MGGFVGGWYATAHPEARVVSIDGFGPGQVTQGDEGEQEASRRFQAPRCGPRSWR